MKLILLSLFCVLTLQQHFTEVEKHDVLHDQSIKTIPKFKRGGRVMQLFHGEHFDDILQDTPDEMRPPALVAFYGHKTCPKEYTTLDFDVNARLLPQRDLLFLASYDIDAVPKRSWYKFLPEMDLKQRFNITKCPQLAFIPRSCNGHTEWCKNKKTGRVGCENFKDQCTGVKLWDGPIQGGGKPAWIEWTRKLVVAGGMPQISSFMENRAKWLDILLNRDDTTCNTHVRNSFVVPHVPAFSETGRLEMDTPPALQEYLMKFYKDHIADRKTEEWYSFQTQMNNHELKTTQIDLDLGFPEKDEVVINHLLPILKNWTGFKDLELTAFFGIREYYPGAYLRPHIDRISTHVISATINLMRLPELPKSKFANLISDESIEWPLQVTDYDGGRTEYSHLPGKTIIYESSKLIHGRPSHLSKGIHVGAFCHFSPKGDDWEKYTNRITANISNMVEYVSYDSAHDETGIFENTVRQQTEQNYFEHTVTESQEDTKDDDDVDLMIVNKNEERIDVYWVSHQGEAVLNCRLQSGDHCRISAGIGHQFFFASPKFHDLNELPQVGEHIYMAATSTEVVIWNDQVLPYSKNAGNAGNGGNDNGANVLQHGEL